MTKIIISIMTIAMLTLPTGTALAAFADLQLIRVVYERTSGTDELASTLGDVSALIASGGSFAGTLPVVSTPANLFAVYWALNRTTNELWVSGSTDTLLAPVAVGTLGFNTTKNNSTSVYSYYNSPLVTADANGVFTGSQGYLNSYKTKMSASQGGLSNGISGTTRVNTEASLALLVTGTAPAKLQNLYYFANANTANSKGVKVAVIANNADGSTTILSNATIAADSTPPSIDTFTLPSTSEDRTFVNLSGFTASDNSGIVAGYLITETDVNPATDATGWTEMPPTSYTFTTPAPYGAVTPVTLFAWAKDLNGNVSLTSRSATVNVTPIDKTAPQVTGLIVPASSSSPTVNGILFSATDDAAVTGYLLNDTGIQPTADDPAWASTAPTSFTFVTNLPLAGDPPKLMTLYAWVKDAMGNIGTMSNTVTLTISAGDVTPPVTTIATPAPLIATSATVSIDISATDDTGVTDYLLTESATPPAVDNAGWVAVTPTANTGSMPVSHIFSGIVPDSLTPKTLYVWTKDAAGNISAEKSILINITIPVLTVTIVNSASDIGNNPGGGEILSDKGGIACPTGNVCSAPFDSVLLPGPVTLSAIPDTDSWFTGWSNNVACNGTAVTCVLSMDASQGVTATFDRLKLVRTTDGSTPKGYFGLVQNALKSAVNGDIIQLTQSPFNESLMLDQVIGSDVVTLAGGFDPAFTAIPTGFTTIQGTLFIKNGKLIADGIAIRP